MERLTHLSERELISFYRGELDADASRRVVRHLLTGCASCRELSSGHWQSETEESREREEEKRFNKIFERAAQASMSLGRAIRQERQAAAAPLAELLRHPTERQKLLVTNSARFHSYGLTEALLDTAFRLGFSDPVQAIAQAEVGIEMAERLRAETYGQRVLNDLKARAWGTLGNAQRIASRLLDAESSIGRGFELLDSGTGDTGERTRLLSFLASLRTEQQRLDEALAIHRKMIRIHKEHGDRHMVGRTHDQMAFVHRLRGDFDKAIACSERALELLDPARDARMVLVTRLSLAHSLFEVGRLDDANNRCAGLQNEFEQLGHDLDALRCGWLLGKVRHRQGAIEEAEGRFRRIRDRFVELEIPLDAALASLDLAEALFDQGKTREMGHRLAEAIPILQNLGIHREAVAALAFLQQATELERVTAGLIRATARFVEKASKDPALRFRASALAAEA